MAGDFVSLIRSSDRCQWYVVFRSIFVYNIYTIERSTDACPIWRNAICRLDTDHRPHTALHWTRYSSHSCKGVDLTGLLGDIKEDWGLGDGSPPAGSRGGAPVGGSAPEAEAFL